MFVTTPNNQVMRSTRKRQRVVALPPPAKRGALVPHDTNRRRAYGDKVYFAGGGPWSSPSTQERTPGVDEHRGRQQVGISLRWHRSSPAAVMVGVWWRIWCGFVAALDRHRRSWRMYTVPAPESRARRTATWKKAARRSGHWQLRSRYQPGILGHGKRWSDDRRSTSRRPLYDVDNHRRVNRRDQGHFQHSPNDSWDWDEVSPPIWSTIGTDTVMD
jgi:alcohol dehydrogenase (cytochrome c)